jgi:hypothetical protein
MRRSEAAFARFEEALKACPTPVSAACDAGRDGLGAGFCAAGGGTPWAWLPVPRRVDSGCEPPWELPPGGPPLRAWQRVDRAFGALTAAFDDPRCDLLARGVGLGQLARAVREVAESLEDPSFSSELAVCTFRFEGSGQVRRLVAGVVALSCDDCVEPCVEIFEEQLGEDWRSPSDEQ